MAHHTQTKEVVHRLSRAIGHLEAVKKMVEEEQDCCKVLVQLAAVRAALGSAGRVLLLDHMSHCVVEAVEQGDTTALEDLEAALERFLR